MNRAPESCALRACSSLRTVPAPERDLSTGQTPLDQGLTQIQGRLRPVDYDHRNDAQLPDPSCDLFLHLSRVVVYCVVCQRWRGTEPWEAEPREVGVEGRRPGDASCAAGPC